MQKVSILFFVFLYFVALLKPIAPFIEYSVNKEFISKVLCINKDKPKMHCEGNCYLTKQLKKASEKEKDNPIPPINLNDYPIALTKQEVFNFQIYLTAIKRMAFYPNIYYKDVIYSIFHPPTT